MVRIVLIEVLVGFLQKNLDYVLNFLLFYFNLMFLDVHIFVTVNRYLLGGP